MRKTHFNQLVPTALSISTRQFSAETQPKLPQLLPETELRPGKVSPPRLVILGPPAGGKGTQCELLEQLLGVVHLSTGDILRQAIRDKSSLGVQAQQFMDKGELVPDKLVVDVVLSRLAEPDCVARGWLLDGFPRTAQQAKILLNARGGVIAPDCVLELEVPDQEVIRRIAGRRVDPVTGKTYHVEFNPPRAEVASCLIQRSDDTEEKIKTRLTQFHAHSKAVRKVFEEYRGDCNATIQVIRASGYQAPPATARAFADAAIELAAKRSLHQIRCDISKRLRRRLDAGGRGVYHVPDSTKKPSYPLRSLVRAHGVPMSTGILREHEPRPSPARGMLRNLLRRLRV